MDINYLLVLFVVINAITPIIGFFRGRPGTPRQWGWLVKCILIIAITGAAHFFAPGKEGIIGFIITILLILIPAFSLQYIQKLFYRQNFRKAYYVSRFASILHPFDGWPQQGEALKAIDLIHQGRVDEAANIVEKHKDPANMIDRWAYTNYLRSTGQFVELIDWFQSSLGLEKLANYPESIINYLNALGETGQTEKLIQEFDRLKPALDNISFKPHLNIARLYLFTYTGKREALEQQFAGPLALMPQDSKDFWLATADQTSGNAAHTVDIFEAMKDSPKYSMRQGCLRRLETPLFQPELSPYLEEILDSEAQAFSNEKTFEEPISFTKHKKKAYGTYALMGAIVAGFLMEIMLGGSQDLATLYRLGAMIKPGNSGEWWRAATSLFLHFGPAHFALNLMGLYLIGPYLENLTGTLRFLLIYFISGFGAMFLAPYFSSQEYILLVGASGSLMGILGATAIILTANTRMDKSGPAKRALVVIIAILLFQFIIDFITPQISQAAHLLGIFIGILICLVLWLPFKQPSTNAGHHGPQKNEPSAETERENDQLK